MKSELIVMLTHNDITVENASEFFKSSIDLPVNYWGFKEQGISSSQMFDLVKEIKKAGKLAVLEVVGLTEEEGLSCARQATDFGFDILMGTKFSKSIHDLLNETNVAYYPFIGNVHSHPSILDGMSIEIIQEAKEFASMGIEGVDLLTYRYKNNKKNPSTLLKDVIDSIPSNVRVVSAGSIDSFFRIDEVLGAGAWGFTVGSALFEKKFVPDGTFRENIQAILEHLSE